MKTFLLSIIFLLPSSILFSQTITIGDDDIVRCKDVPIGTTQTIFGDTYEVVDRALLIQRRDEGADLTKVCVSNVTDMNYMFQSSSFNQPIGNWDVSSVTNMGHMFSSSQFNQPIGKWDVSNVTDMNTMFFSTPFNQPIGDWNVSSVTDMNQMFVGVPLIYSIENWDVSNVKVMARMFQFSSFNQPIGNWDVSNVKVTSYMFSSSQFNQPIGNWNMSSATDLSFMFQSSPFNQSIGNWNVSSVTSMEGMFNGNQSFNQPIGNWDVSSVTNMSSMFRNARLFSQPIGDWDVSNVTNMVEMFLNSRFNQPIGDWDVSSVLNMDKMFRGSLFNQPIGNWNVSSVTNMNYMFSYSTDAWTHPFNQPIGNWDVSNVSNMNGMFVNSDFNQPINQWCVINFTFEPFDFSTNSLLIPAYKPIWGACPIETPSPLTQIHPNNNTTNVSRILDLNWKSDKLATKYQLQLFEGNNPMVLDTLISDTTYTNQIPLKSNFEYNWRVRGLNENRTINEQPLTGDWSEIWRFTTGFFQAFDLVSPLDSTLLEELSPTFVWNSEPNAEAYEIQISNDEFSTFVVNEVVTDTTFTTPTLSYSTEYQWRVRGTNDAGESEWSTAWSFSVQLPTSNEKENNPNEFVLNQNYPNPFNPTTQIQFSLPKTTHVKIEVYSIMGQLITTLVNGTMNVGSHTVSFDGKSFSSGMYIYRLSTSEFTQSRMMNLIK